MDKANRTIPLMFMVVLVAGVAFYRAGHGDRLSTEAVDNSGQGVVIEVSGPGINSGSYRFFSKPLTLMQLCVNINDAARCLSRMESVEDHVLASGDAVYFPAGLRPPRTGRMPGSRRLVLGIPLDPNRDGIEDLVAVPGIGPKKAERIVKRREEKGPFKNLDQLQEFVGAGIPVSEYFRVE